MCVCVCVKLGIIKHSMSSVLSSGDDSSLSHGESSCSARLFGSTRRRHHKSRWCRWESQPSGEQVKGQVHRYRSRESQRGSTEQEAMWRPQKEQSGPQESPVGVSWPCGNSLFHFPDSYVLLYKLICFTNQNNNKSWNRTVRQQSWRWPLWLSERFDLTQVLNLLSGLVVLCVHPIDF